MAFETRDEETSCKLRAIKQLYQGRQYKQCAKECVDALASCQGEIHSIHQAYLNFYTALSHDTLAREATLRGRYKALGLAEKYYIAAIAVLDSPVPALRYADDQLSSPTSAVSDEDQLWNRRRTSTACSFDSNASAVSSATSFDSNETHTEYSPKQHFLHYQRFAHDFVPNLTTISALLAQHNAPLPQVSRLSAPLLANTVRLSAQTTSFIHMLEAHLADVRDRRSKTHVPTVRFSDSLPTSPTTTSKLRKSRLLSGEEASERWEKRRSVVSRKKFDPEAVKRLCEDALAELGSS